MGTTTFRVGLRDGVRVVGRDPACDVVLVDPRVSQRHLSITRTGASRWEVTDLGSRNGAFLGGRRLGTAEITGRTTVVLGHPDTGLVLELVPEPSVDAPTVTDGGAAGASPATRTRALGDRPAGILVQDLVVRRGGRELVSHLTATLPAAKLTAIIGPSGAGKSTLLAAITGAVPATSGRVLIDGQDLATAGSTLTSRMGVVPQEDVLHTTLTVRASLRYSARLRMPPATSRADRAAAVDRVLGQLRLTAHAGTRIDRLSGGQRKRVNAASELLTRPGLLVLDEPTSGLDPHLERTVMQDLAALAAEGCTVVVVTHSTATLDLADHVIAVGAGRLLYEGPPAGLPAHFDARGMGTVFAEMGGEAVQQWAERWREGGAAAAAPPPPRRATTPAMPLPQHEPAGSRRHQLLPLLSRDLRLLAADRGSLALLLAQAPALGLLTRLFPDGGGFGLQTAPNPDVRTLVLVLVLAATWLGTFAAIRQIVDERPVVLREFAAGVSPLYYLIARSAVLAGLVVVQVLCLTGAALFGRSLPQGRVLLEPGVELVVTLIAAGWVAATVGLLVSAVARTGAGAAALAPLVVVPQLLLCGALLAVHENPVLDLVTRLVSARAAFSAAASSVDLVGLEAGSPASAPPAAWSADGVTWCVDLVELATLGALVWLAVWVVLRRLRRPTR